MGQFLEAYEEYKRERQENFDNVTFIIIEMLLFNGFYYYPIEDLFLNIDTNTKFYLFDLEKYKSVLEFQIEYPYYSICGN